MVAWWRLFALLLAGTTGMTFGEVKPSAWFGDHSMLQAGQRVNKG